MNPVLNSLCVRHALQFLPMESGTQPTIKSQIRRSADSEPHRLKRAPVVTREALARCGWPEQLDKEIEELKQTEKLLSAEFPDLFGG